MVIPSRVAMRGLNFYRLLAPQRDEGTLVDRFSSQNVPGVLSRAIAAALLQQSRLYQDCKPNTDCEQLQHECIKAAAAPACTRFKRRKAATPKAHTARAFSFLEHFMNG